MKRNSTYRPSTSGRKYKGKQCSINTVKMQSKNCSNEWTRFDKQKPQLKMRSYENSMNFRYKSITTLNYKYQNYLRLFSFYPICNRTSVLIFSYLNDCQCMTRIENEEERTRCKLVANLNTKNQTMHHGYPSKMIMRWISLINGQFEPR